MQSPTEQHAFIAEVLTKTGWSQSDLASRAGLDPSTLSRFLTKDREGHALRASTIQRIAKASGFAFDKIPKTHQEGLAETEADPYVFNLDDPLADAIHALRSRGRNIDPWILKNRALESSGYRPGDILLVGLSETPHVGDVVCAQIYDWKKGQAETVFRLYQPPALISSTTIESLQTPYLLADTSVVVKGVVLHSLRSRA